MCYNIPFKLIIPKDQNIVDVFLDNKASIYTKENYADNNTIKFFISIKTKKIEIIAEVPEMEKTHELQSNNSIQNVKIAIIKTKFNAGSILYWRTFIKDHIGLEPIIIDDLFDINYKNIDFTLIIAPNVQYLTPDIKNWVETLIKNGTGIILTESVPDNKFLSLEITEKVNKCSIGLLIEKEHKSIKPFKINDIIPFKQQIPTIKCKSGMILVSVINNCFFGYLERKLASKRFYINLNRITTLHTKFLNSIYIYSHKLSIKKTPAIIIDTFNKGKIFYFAFDPIYQVYNDSRFDQGKYHLSRNANFLQIAISALQWASKVIIIKGIYKDDKIPVLYSIDTEASVNYYDIKKKKCLHCIDKNVVDDCMDLKMEKCLLNAAARLENFGARGTFHMDTGGMYDKKDAKAIELLRSKHDISVHQGKDGQHKNWHKNISNTKYIFDNLSDCITKLKQITKNNVYGIRYPGWVRVPNTHDIVANLDLKYDTSSVSHSPFAAIPFRFFSNSNNEPLDLFELPCIEIGSALNRRVKPPFSKIVNILTVQKVKDNIKQAYEHKGIIVLMDHDMTIGANPGHIHRTVQFNNDSFKKIMSYCYNPELFPDIWITTGSEFIMWYSMVRNLKISSFEIIRNKALLSYIIRIE